MYRDRVVARAAAVIKAKSIDRACCNGANRSASDPGRKYTQDQQWCTASEIGTKVIWLGSHRNL